MEQELVVRARQGDQQAFEALTVTTHPRLFRAAYGIVRDGTAAEEATQQAFIDIWRFLRRLPDPARFEAWSYGLVVDACEQESERMPPSGDVEAIPGAGADPVDPYRAVANRDQLGRGFEELSLDQRAVIILRYLLDLSVEDTAEALGVAAGTVDSRLSRALSALRAALETDTGAGDAEAAVTADAASEKRLAQDLRAWLRESDVPPPDAHMSAGRVMAGVSGTRQLGRWFPPARLTPRARPVPVLGPRDASSRRSTKGVLSTFTAPRVAGVMLAFALAVGALLVGRSLLPTAVEPTSTSASPPPAAELTAEPAPATDDRLTSSLPAASAFVASDVIAELPPGSDPVGLVPAPSHRPGAAFIDRANAAVMHAEDDGQLRVLAQAGIDDLRRHMEAAPMALDSTGSSIVVIDDAGGLYSWEQWRDLGRLADGPSAERGGDTLATIDPPPSVIGITPSDGRDFRLDLIDPSSGDLVTRQVLVTGDGQLALHEGAQLIGRAVADHAVDLATGATSFVLTPDGVERFAGAELDPGWALEQPAGNTPDYRALAVAGTADAGRIWLADAAAERFTVFAASDGSFLGSWALAGEPIDDVRGMYLLEGSDGVVESVTWLTDRALMRAALERPQAVRPYVTPAPTPSGQLTANERDGGKRAIDWSDGGVELKADALTLKVDGHPLVRAPRRPYIAGNTYANEASLEAEWRDGATEQRLSFVFDLDDTHWWLDWIWAYDGEKSGDWIEFQHLEDLTRTPLGESLVGDLRVESTNASRAKYDDPGSAVLRLDGLKLTALQPGTRPAPLTGCTPYEDESFEITREPAWESEEDTWSTSYAGKTLRGRGEPLEGMKASNMTPEAVETVLEDLGICYRFRHEWERTVKLDDGRRVKDDLIDWRCSAPKTGKVMGLEPGPGHPAEGGTAVMYVTVREQKERNWPEPPPAGTDCPTQ